MFVKALRYNKKSYIFKHGKALEKSDIIFIVKFKEQEDQNPLQ